MKGPRWRTAGTASILALILLGFLWGGAGCGAPAEVKAPNFNDSTPLSGDVYAAQPVNVTLNFRIDVDKGSLLSVTGAGKEWATGPVLIEDQNTVIKRATRQEMGKGTYVVTYTAKFANGSSGKGRFSFAIDPALLSEYEDMRGEEELTVAMKHLAFVPRLIEVSPGSKITWVNEEEAGHFVNTETHPEHTYIPEMNSGELQVGGTFSVTLTMPGQYDYHCSAHYPEGMKGSIVVAE